MPTKSGRNRRPCDRSTPRITITSALAIAASPTAGPDVDLRVRDAVASEYADVLTAEALAAIRTLVPFDRDRVDLMTLRLERRATRARDRRRIAFLDPAAPIAGTKLTVQDARDCRFTG